MKRSFRASAPEVILDPAANLTFILGSDGADSERRDCFDPLDTVRRRDIIGAWEAASVSGVVGALEDAVICVSGEVALGLRSPTSPMDVQAEPYEDGPAVWGDMEIELSDEGHSALA